jgi:hypothetical protein
LPDPATSDPEAKADEGNKTGSKRLSGREERYRAVMAQSVEAIFLSEPLSVDETSELLKENAR